MQRRPGGTCQSAHTFKLNSHVTTKNKLYFYVFNFLLAAEHTQNRYGSDNADLCTVA